MVKYLRIAWLIYTERERERGGGEEIGIGGSYPSELEKVNDVAEVVLVQVALALK
jgi:hypothetical protein